MTPPRPGGKPVMAVHSTTAARDPTMQAALNADAQGGGEAAKCSERV